VVFESSVRYVAEMIIESKKTVALTGAGISTESGIPDFRGPEGLWKKIDPRLVTIQSFRMFPEVFWYFIAERFESLMKAQPNKAHYALAELEKIGKLSSIITQNVDGLHFKAGSKNVIELHGNMREAICMNCSTIVPMDEALKMAKRNYYLPMCKSCGGILKANVILFNEPLPKEAIEKALCESRTCDLMLVIGTSLQVYPAAYMPAIAKQRGAKLAIINMEPTPLDDSADVVIHAKAGEVLPVIVGIIKEKLMRAS